MKPGYRLLIIVALATLAAYVLTWLPERVQMLFMVGGPLLFLLIIIIHIVRSSEGTPAVVPAGSVIQWRDMVGGRSPSWWVFFPVPGDQTRYYKVYDHKLYLMGVGYTIAKDYDGVLIERP